MLCVLVVWEKKFINYSRNCRAGSQRLSGSEFQSQDHRASHSKGKTSNASDTV